MWRALGAANQIRQWSQLLHPARNRQVTRLIGYEAKHKKIPESPDIAVLIDYDGRGWAQTACKLEWCMREWNAGRQTFLGYRRINDVMHWYFYLPLPDGMTPPPIDSLPKHRLGGKHIRVGFQDYRY